MYLHLYFMVGHRAVNVYCHDHLFCGTTTTVKFDRNAVNHLWIPDRCYLLDQYNTIDVTEDAEK